MHAFQFAEQMTHSAVRVTQNAKAITMHGIRWLRQGRPDPAVSLRELFEDLGATYIKIGQFIASTPSFFPEPFVEAFQNCLDKTPPLPFSKIQQVIESELGGPISDFFSYIDPIPLASASIGQVHSARTLNDHDVVIKVQKPGVETILRTDLQLVHTSSVILEKCFPQLKMASLSAICDEMKQGMLQECDFLAELKELEKFRAFIQKKGMNQVTAPMPYPHLSTRRVLTMERLYGSPFTDLDPSLCEDPEGALINGMNAWFATLLEGHSFHADVHAGNLLVLKDGRVGFIDFGIVGKVKQQTWSGVQRLVNGLTQTNFKEIAYALHDIGMTEHSIDIEQFARDIKSIFEDRHEHGDNYDKKLVQITQAAREYGIHFPREFALLMKQLLYFDRYIQLISPQIHFYQDARLDFI